MRHAGRHSDAEGAAAEADGGSGAETCARAAVPTCAAKRTAHAMKIFVFDVASFDITDADARIDRDCGFSSACFSIGSR